jgi:hypothetical protein
MKILLSLGLALFSAASLAATPANLFECTGVGVKVNYTATTLKGNPSLSFKVGSKTFTGSGKEITDEVTVLGHLLTITRTVVPDFNKETLTLLLPDVNVVDFGASEMFDTRVLSLVLRPPLAAHNLWKVSFKIIPRDLCIAPGRLWFFECS